MKVLKFGGTSVGSAKHIKSVISIVDDLSKSSKLAVVVSAVGGVTDKLLLAGTKAVQKDASYLQDLKAIKDVHLSIIAGLGLTQSKALLKKFESYMNELESLLNGIYLINELSARTTAKLLSFGELLSSMIIYEAMLKNNMEVLLVNTQNLIITNSFSAHDSVNFSKTNDNIISVNAKNLQKVILYPGFISKSEDGQITTLGRGGSDYTAAIIASALGAEELQIWTDVSGMFTTNPKLVKQAMPIKEISYHEAVELSHFGAKVLYPPSIYPVLNKKIPIWIKNTMAPSEHGTLITTSAKDSNLRPVKGISNINSIALLTLQGNGMVGIPGFSKRLFETLAQEKINIILTTQASSEHAICIAVAREDAHKAKIKLDETFSNEIALKQIDPLVVEKKLSIIAIVGDNMKNHQGISGKMFSSLGKNNINIRAIAQGASERNISAVIAENDVKKALNTLHESFFEVETKQINLFVTGVGNVGERLLKQLHHQIEYVKKNLHINLRVIGLSNSKKMYFDQNGIDLSRWKTLLPHGDKANITHFFEKTLTLNLRNSLFIDATANNKVADIYAKYLQHSIGVIACNKIACSGDYAKYSTLKRLSRKYNAPFLFETTVGAGLPIIDTLNHLITSGDQIHSIEAVLSGSLNFIFNDFDASKPFHNSVKRAQLEGYTEPDPRIDLSGIDVARKILILARESGSKLNIEAIKNDSFLTENALKANTVDDFYQALAHDDAHYKNLYLKAKSKDCKLKFVAEFKDGKAGVGLKEVPKTHPFYNLEGKDNVVTFFTDRYPVQPLIVKGAGAGADVTASGLFADIIRIANN